MNGKELSISGTTNLFLGDLRYFDAVLFGFQIRKPRPQQKHCLIGINLHRTRNCIRLKMKQRPYRNASSDIWEAR